ncbi:MAG TPA: hypothetical protein VHW46_00700 [Terracidiphilus sp.]|jgi:hypothetical protein|nr:hypothetical protein [Terracidiphilus sp.]
MEIFLNLAWSLLAIASVLLWTSQERRIGSERRLPLIALVLLLMMLFPVISVSDDLWAVQNPAEADTCLRRDHVVTCPHCALPAPAVFPTFLGPIDTSKPQFRTQIALTMPRNASSVLHPIESRPPPAV